MIASANIDTDLRARHQRMKRLVSVGMSVAGDMRRSMTMMDETTMSTAILPVRRIARVLRLQVTTPNAAVVDAKRTITALHDRTEITVERLVATATGLAPHASKTNTRMAAQMTHRKPVAVRAAATASVNANAKETETEIEIEIESVIATATATVSKKIRMVDDLGATAHPP